MIDELTDYQREDVRRFQQAEEALAGLKPEIVARLYQLYSQETAYANWLAVNAGTISNFTEWCFETPVQRVLKEAKG